MTLAERINQLTGHHGGLRPTARLLQMDPAYLIRLRDGKKANPSPTTLRKLGLQRIVTVTYRRTL